MTWNRGKWNKFISDNTAIPPTDAAAQAAADEAKELAETYEEDIDLDALGVQRIKEFLAAFALTIPGSTGSIGPSGAPSSDAIQMVASTKRLYTGAVDKEILRYTFPARELHGNKDLIKVSCYMHNLTDVKVEWIAAATKTLFTYAPTNPSNGQMDLWIAEATNPFDAGSLRSFSRAIGVTAGVYENTNIEANWMYVGGTLTVTLSPDDATLPWGGIVSISKLIFPKVTVE